MINAYGQINLDKIGEIIKSQPDIVKTVTFKDGTRARMLDINVFTTKNPDKFGNTIAIKARCAKDKVRKDVNYYFGNMKESEEKQPQPSVQSTAPTQAPEPAPANDPDLPF